MSNLTQTKSCACPGDCVSYRYSISVSSTKVNSDDFCRRHKETFSSPRFVGPPIFMRNFNVFVHDEKSDYFEICKSTLEDVAIVRFQISGQNIVQFKKDLRLTFADQISNFGKTMYLHCACTFSSEGLTDYCYLFSGGTLGLFTGMSILSFCEVIFWLLRFVLSNNRAKRVGNE